MIIERLIIPKTTLYIVRHGQSKSNENLILSGFSDNPKLTEKGIRQAHDTKKKLEHVKFDTAYSSDLTRAVDTGEIIYGKSIHKDHQIHKLRERSFGVVEGESQYLIDKAHKLIATLTPDEKWRYQHFPGMESDHTLSERFIAELQEIAKREVGKNILIAAHGGAIRTTLMSLDKKTYQHLSPRSFRNGGYVVLTYDGEELTVIEAEGLNHPSE